MFSRLYWRKVKSLSKVCIIKVNSELVHKLRMPNFASTQASDLKANDPGVRIEQGPPPRPADPRLSGQKREPDQNGENSLPYG